MLTTPMRTRIRARLPARSTGQTPGERTERAPPEGVVLHDRLSGRLRAGRRDAVLLQPKQELKRAMCMTSLLAVRRPRRILAGVLAAFMTLTACSSAVKSDADQAAAGGAPADAGKTLPEAVPEEGGKPASDRQIARTAGLTIVVEDLATAATTLRQVAASFGGSVTSENLITGSISAEDEQRTIPSSFSTIVLSVPSERLDEALDAAAAVGELRVRTVSAEDVTTQVVDVEARITTMRESIARVRALMERAGTLTEIARLEAELTRRQADLESLVAQQKVLAAMVDQATIAVTIITRRQAEVASDGFLGGLQAGWAALLASGRVLLTLLGAVLPFALVLAVAGAPVWWVVRRRRARHRGPAAGEPRPTAGVGGKAPVEVQDAVPLATASTQAAPETAPHSDSPASPGDSPARPSTT